MVGIIGQNDDLPIGMMSLPGLEGDLTEGGEVGGAGVPVGPD